MQQRTLCHGRTGNFQTVRHKEQIQDSTFVYTPHFLLFLTVCVYIPVCTVGSRLIGIKEMRDILPVEQQCFQLWTRSVLLLKNRDLRTKAGQHEKVLIFTADGLCRVEDCRHQRRQTQRLSAAKTEAWAKSRNQEQ